MLLPTLLTFILIVIILFVVILSCFEIGWKVRHSHKKRDEPDADSGLGAIDGAVFGLMGLLIAFTFTGAAARFETRRDLIVQETNAMGTAWLRLDLLPSDAQSIVRAEMRDYVDSRIDLFRLVSYDQVAAEKEFARGIALQQKIWSDSATALKQQGSPAATSLLLAALNDMIDITTTRYVAMLTHPPLAIYIVLGFFVLASSLLAGYGMGKSDKRNWTHRLLFSATLALAMYIILDLDYPRLGLIRINTMDQIMVDLRNSMN
jgi:hypothetical protein